MILSSIKAAFAAILLLLMPLAAAAQEHIPNQDGVVYGSRLLRTSGQVWETSYVADKAISFYLSASGRGTSSGQDLSLVRFGINSATHSFTSFTGTPPILHGDGDVGPVTFAAGEEFKVVFTLVGAPTRPVRVDFYGTYEVLPVPEIGTEGAVAALMLVFGGMAVMSGRRRKALA